MMQKQIARLVTNRARKAVGDFLGSFADAEAIIGNLDQAMKLFSVLRNDELIPALVEVLEARGGIQKIFVAWMISYMSEKHPGVFKDADAEKLAAEVLMGALQSDRYEELLFVLVYFPAGGQPREAEPILHKLIDSEYEYIRVAAAAALVANGLEEVDARFNAFQILRQTWQGDDQVKIALTSVALNRAALSGRIPVGNLLVAFENASAPLKYQFLLILESLGPKAREAVAAVLAAFNDEELPPATRSLAGRTLGAITRGTNVARKELLTALKAREWPVIKGAADGLIRQGGATEQVSERLMGLLLSNSADIRCGAAYCLKQIPDACQKALPTLIDRLGKEPSADVISEIAQAIQAAGDSAISLLISVIRQQDARRVQWVGVVLTMMGQNAAVALADELRGGGDLRVLGSFLMILREMGWQASPAVPALADILDQAEDEDTAFLAMAAIMGCGRMGEPALNSIVRCVMNRSDEVAELAARSLKLIGYPAIAALEEATPNASGEARERLEQVLQYAYPEELKRLRYLQLLGRDDLLRMFVLVGDFVAEEKKASWATIASEIVPKVNFLRVNGSEFGSTRNTIRSAVEDLAQLLGGGRLLDNKDRKKGGLTRKGRTLLQDAHDYLDRKYGTGSESS